MEALFLKILNMSITASYVILAVILLRLLLRNAPRKYSYALWAAVGFRLCCPFSFPSLLSLFNLGIFEMDQAQQASTQLTFIPADIAYQRQPEISVGIPFVNGVISDSLPAPAMGDSANPLQVWQFVGTVLWCTGMLAMLVYSVTCDVRLRLKLRNAMHLENNVWQSDRIPSPFIHGVLKPRIYIPFEMSDMQRQCVLDHERCHLKRFDHVAQLAAYGLLVLHWFNPLVWLAFRLFGRDMEMSCDEAVLRVRGNCTDYSETLLSIAANHRFSLASPLAFGETDVKRRIINALNWKKPSTIVTVVCIILCICALIICAANPVSGTQSEDGPPVRIPGLSNDAEKADFQFGVSYVTDECNYMSLLSSFLPIEGDSGCRYYFLEDSFIIEYKHSGGREEISNIKWEWQEFPFTDSQWQNMHLPLGTDFPEPPYDDDQYLPLNQRYFLLRNENGLYIVQHGVERNGEPYVWSVFRLKPEGSNGPENTLDSAIRQAIRINNLDIHKDDLISGHLAVSYVTLAQDTLYEDRLEHETGERIGTITVYLLAMYGEYKVDNNGIHEVVSSFSPAALTFAQYEDVGYVLTQYWTSDDNNFEASLREKFSADSAINAALNEIEYFTAMKQDQYRQVIEYYELDTDSYLSDMLEYLYANSVTLREVTYYGTYALEYCFREFLSGNLEGMKAERMVYICQEIMDSLGEAVVIDGEVTTPEAWFRVVKDNALNLSRQYSGEELEKMYPASYLLLQLMEK